MQYRPEIDGLRTIAVLPVILFHAGIPGFSGGYVGVDVFFVISGYLITHFLIERITTGKFSLIEFYSRRAKRILPALFLVVFICVPVAWLTMMPSQFKDFAQSVTAVSLFLSNILFWLESGYFAAAAEEKPLLHTWSLAVEEQYYLFFPLLLLMFFRVGRRLVGPLLVLCIVLSLAASEVLAGSHPDLNFYGIATRAWELMIGSLCALWLYNREQSTNEGSALAGLILITGATVLFDDQTPFPSLWTLVPVLGTGLIIVYAASTTLTARILSMRLMVGIGLISYSAYLWHQPLFAFARLNAGHVPSTSLMLCLSVIALFLAFLSWKYVEQPCRRTKWQSKKIVFFSGVISGCVAIIGLGLGYSGLHNKYFLSSLSDQNQVVLENINRIQETDHYGNLDHGKCVFRVSNYDSALDERLKECYAEFGKALVLFGDSHFIDIFQGLAQHSRQPFIVGVGQGACRPHVEDAPCSDSDLVRFLQGNADKIKLAIYSQAGFWLLKDRDGKNTARHIFLGPATPFATPDMDKITRVTHFLQGIGRSLPLAWLGPRIEPHVTMEKMLSIECDTAPDHFTPGLGHESIFRNLDTAIRHAAEHNDITYISEIEAIQFDTKHDIYDCNHVYWSDGDHWSPAGEKRFGQRLALIIDPLISRNSAE